MSTTQRMHVARPLVGLLLATVACGRGDPVVGFSAEAIGRWSLQSYDGRALPALVVAPGAATVEVVSGALELNRDGTYLMVTSYRMTENGTVTSREETGSGSWYNRGNQISLSPNSGADRGVASLAGDRMTLYAVGADGRALLIVYGR